MVDKDFLRNRTQQVVLNRQKSGSIPITSGLPQGSVLGPLYTVPSIVSSLTFMFADDMKIFRFIKSGDDHAIQCTSKSLELTP